MDIGKIINSAKVDEISGILPKEEWKNLGSISKKRATIEAQSNDHTISLCSLNSKEFAKNPQLFLKSQLIVSSYYGFDKPCIDYDFYNIESEALGQKLIYRDGILPEIDFKEPLLSDKKTLYKLKSPVYKRKGRFCYVVNINKLFKSILGFSPRLRFCGPFSIAVNLRGYNNLMIDMEDDKGFVKDLFDFLTYEVIIPWVKLQRDEIGEQDASAGGVEATATFPNISTKTMEEWIIPYYEKTKQELGNVTFTTCCGGIYHLSNPEDFFGYQLYSCPGIAKGYQWDIEKVGFKVFNDYAKKNNLHLRLGVSASTLLGINEDRAVDLVKRYLEKGGVGLSSYSLYLSAIDPGTNPKIILTIANAVKQLGVFPIEKKIKRSFFEAPKYINFEDWLLARI